VYSGVDDDITYPLRLCALLRVSQILDANDEENTTLVEMIAILVDLASP
jgi:hypothetical protein